MPRKDGADWVERLTRLGCEVRQRLQTAARGDGTRHFALPVAHESGDTIYGIDRHVEPVIEAAIEQWPASCKPLVLVAEGMGHDGVRRFGPPNEESKYRVIIDPIDGTRSLMYDKRPGWFLAAVAPDRGAATRLSHTFAAVMVELPLSKQGAMDHFTTVAGEPTLGFRLDAGQEHPRPLPVRPSAAMTLQDGFAQVANFFPGTKVLAAELMERIAERALGAVRPGRADVFDDQYISTGGQLVELMVGHDRFCCDLRPLFYEILDRKHGAAVARGVQCHPYDLAGMLVARQAGVVLTDGLGRPLDGPLDVHHGMHWCGYANPVLRERIEPIILEWLHEQGVG